MSVKLLTEHHLEFLSFKGGCTGLSEHTLVKMPHFGNHMSRLNLSLSLYGLITFLTGGQPREMYKIWNPCTVFIFYTFLSVT